MSRFSRPSLALCPLRRTKIPPAAWTSVGGKNLLTEDALTLSHTESIEDEMVLNETNAIDDYRVSEEWMLNFQSKDYTAETLQRAINNKPHDMVEPPGMLARLGYIRIPLRKGPAVEKWSVMARIDDSPYRTGLADPIRTQITFLNASQRNGFESTLGPKTAGRHDQFRFQRVDPCFHCGSCPWRSRLH